MRKFLFVLMSLFVSSSALAADKSEIWDILQRIDSELRYYDQSPNQLDQTKVRLEEVLRLLRGGNSQDPNQCLNFAIEEFVKDGFSQSTAMQKAKSLCSDMERNGSAFAVVNYFYLLLKQDGYSVTSAFQISSDLAKNLPESSLSCVKPAFERYKKDGFSNRTALNNAVNFCKR
jgi:hypothetical protein